MEQIQLPAQAEAPARAQQLQFLRFLAFLNIFISHGEVWNFFGYPATSSAAFAVSFFFSLSGLVTGYSAYGRRTDLSVSVVGKHMWKKIKKVYPLYVLTMTIPLLHSTLPELIAVRDMEAVAGEVELLVRNLLLVQSWFQEGYFHLNGVGWFLSTLLFLNLFDLPGLFFLKKTEDSKYRNWLLPGMLAGVCLLAVLYCGLTRHLRLSYWHYIFPPARLGEYMAGMILGYGIRGFWPKIQMVCKKNWFFTGWEAACLILWACYLYFWGSYWTHHSVHWLLPNLLLLAAFTMGRGEISRLFRWKPLVWLGDISFECFLVHQLFVVRYDIVHSVSSVTSLDQMLAFFYCLGMTILASAVLHKGTK